MQLEILNIFKIKKEAMHLYVYISNEKTLLKVNYIILKYEKETSKVADALIRPWTLKARFIVLEQY